MSLSKRLSCRLLCVAAVSVVVSASSLALAQPAPPDGTPPAGQRSDGRPRPMMQAFEDYGQLIRDLNLNADQTAHVREVMRTAREAMQAAARDAQTMSPQDRLAGFREAMDAMNADIATTLNDEQRKTFEARTAEIRAKTEANFRQARTGGDGGATSQPTTRPGQFRPGGPGGPAGIGARIFDRIDRALDAAGVTAEQHAKLDPVLADAREKIAAVIADAQANGAPDPQAIRSSVREIIDSMREKASAILTPEQIDKFRAAMQPPNGPQGGPNGGPNGGGGRRGPGNGNNNNGGNGNGNGGNGSGGNGEPPPPPAPPPPGDKPAAAAPPAHDSTATSEAGTAGLAASESSAVPILAIGEAMPSFDLIKVDGHPVSTKSLAGKPAVLIFGSLTAPSFRDRAATLGQLAKKYGSRVRFLVIYTREQHPVGGDEPERNRDDHIAVAAHATAADRTAAAKTARDQLGLTLDMAPDTMDDRLTKQLDGFPNGAVVFDSEGKLIERQRWVEPFALERALDRLLARK